ncbi:MAG: hypothetical protein IJT03_03650 [Clostridia bacterium]|nr:hypothetical protein [Clostridia bacterium]
MKIFKRLTGILLIVALLCLCACGADDNNAADEQKAAQVKYTVPAGFASKNETVYVNLDPSGAVSQTIVSDWIHTDKSQVYVNDVTNLKEIENIKDDSVPEVMGQNLKWYMNSTDLYYQGKTDAGLPLSFSFSYLLNGNQILPDELIGKSGKVTIKINMSNLDSHKVTVNGRSITMYNPMLVVGGVLLDESKFQNITVTNGKTIGDGSKQYAVLTGFPGINDSLGLKEISSETSDGTYNFEDNFEISADVTDFEIGNFMFSAIPISSLDIGLNSISSSMDDVRGNLSKLQTVQKSLSNLNIDSILNSFTADPNKINNLSYLVEQASNLYDNNKALINVLNKYTTPENIATIQALTEYIGSADIEGLQSSLEVINKVFGDEASAERIRKGMDLLRQMSNDLSDPDVKSAIANLPQTVSTLSSLQSAIDENRDLINALKTLSDTNALAAVQSALSGVEGTLAAGGLSELTNMTINADELTSRMTAWIELGKTYKIFTKVNSGMSSKVMFVFKVDALKTITTPDSTDGEAAPQKKENGFFSWLKKLFGSDDAENQDNKTE